MNPIIYFNSDLKNAYDKKGIFSSIKDRFKIKFESESRIKDLDLNISKIKLPPNFNRDSYFRNLKTARNHIKYSKVELAPKTYRYLDYCFFSEFQKKLFAYSVVNSIKLMLRVSNRSIKNSCIVVYDAIDSVNSNIIKELAKECKYFILLSENISKVRALSDSIIANYGISPVITNDNVYAINKSDFIITSRNIEVPSNKNVWYLNNMYVPEVKNSIMVNDVTYCVPWEIDEEMTLELLGAILNQMGEKDIEASLKYNGIFLDKIKFKEDVSFSY